MKRSRGHPGMYQARGTSGKAKAVGQRWKRNKEEENKVAGDLYTSRKRRDDKAVAL